MRLKMYMCNQFFNEVFKLSNKVIMCDIKTKCVYIFCDNNFCHNGRW